MRFFDIPYLKSSDAMFASRQKNILRRNTRSFSPVNLESVTAQMALMQMQLTKYTGKVFYGVQVILPVQLVAHRSQY